MAKRIAESMGGRISVTSEVGVGSTFTLHLAPAGESHLSEPEGVPGATRSDMNENILLVEDQDALRLRRVWKDEVRICRAQVIGSRMRKTQRKRMDALLSFL